MDNLARELERDEEVLGRRGTVRKKGPEGVHVETRAGSVVAQRAASCLLDPAVGDEVLVGASGQEAWLLAVLRQDATRSTEISVEGDLRLRSSRGKVAVVGQEGVELISAGVAKVVSSSLEVRSLSASVVVDGLDFVGGWVRSEVDRVKLIAQSLDQVVDRFSQRARRSYRRVEDIDQLQAGTVHHRVEKTMRLHAGDAAVTADGIVKVDGKQVHVG